MEPISLHIRRTAKPQALVRTFDTVMACAMTIL